VLSGAGLRLSTVTVGTNLVRAVLLLLAGRVREPELTKACLVTRSAQ